MGHPNEEFMKAFFKRHAQHLEYWSLNSLVAKALEEYAAVRPVTAQGAKTFQEELTALRVDLMTPAIDAVKEMMTDDQMSREVYDRGTLEAVIEKLKEKAYGR